MGFDRRRRKRSATKTITSDWGESVEYEVKMFGARDGIKLAPRVMRVFGESFGEVLSSINLAGTADAARDAASEAINSEGSKIEGEQLLGSFSIVNLLESDLDLARAGRAIENFATKLVAEGGHELIMEIMANTTRREEGGKPIYISTSGTEFDQAYQGNYGELVKALAFVLDVNFGAAFGRRPFGVGG